MPVALSTLAGVRWRGDPVAGDRPRALIQALVAAGSAGGSEASLIEAVWGADLPANPTKALQVLVSRVRTATDAHLVERTPHGYRLGLGRDEVDTLAQADLQASAHAAYRNGNVDAAWQAAEDALALGPCEGAERLLAIAASRAGDHATALPALERLAGRHPTDEELLGCLLRSVAAVRGPSAALERYEHHRADLADRTGSDPGPALQDVHRELLAADRPLRHGVLFDGTPLLGRDADVRALCGLVREFRVVSIVGAGGLGKTRLAHVLGRESDLPVVYFVELVGITSPADVVGELGSALGVRDSITGRKALSPEQRADMRGRIAQHLDTAPTLLILDNCEHVAAAVADLVGYLVATTRDLRVITTTRAPLSIAAERVYALEALAVSDGVELFRQRATAARPNVSLDHTAVADIVTRLDGLPLAIELAAAKVRVMSVEDVSRRLTNRFALLRGGDRSAPDRHQTLLAVIDWSWNLLSERSRRALAHLAVFHDGFTLDAAEAVVGQGALGSLEDLAHQSLLVVTEPGSGVRYRMLETVREFGRMQLVDAGEDAAALRAQTAWACAYADAHLGELYGPRQFEAADALTTEEANLADALRRSLAEPDPDSAVALMAALSSLWSLRGEHERVISLVDALDAAVSDWTPPVARLDQTRIALGMTLTNSMIASPFRVTRLRALLERVGTASRVPWIAAICAVTLAATEPDLAVQRQRLDELAKSTDRHESLVAMQLRSHIQENDGDPEAAISDTARCLELCTDGDGPWQRASLQTQLAQLHAQLGHHDIAPHLAKSALPVLVRLGATDDVTQTRSVICIGAIVNGDLDQAERISTELTDAQSRRPGVASNATFAVGAAEVALARGDTDSGLHLYRIAIDRMRAVRFHGMGDPTGLEPWTLFGESAALVAHVLHGRGPDARDLWNILRAKAPAMADGPFHDYPVMGAVLFGLGTWALLGDELPHADAVRLLVLAERFGYARQVPTMAWENAAAPAERVAPGLIARLRAEYGDRRGPALLDHARTLLAQLFGQDSRVTSSAGSS